MCGISGYVGSSQRGLQFLHEARACLAHRGPDGYGLYIGNGFGFGHCRLALIDKSNAGAQPKESSGHVLSFNGEIYNWKELRIELRNSNVNSASNSDSEILLLSLREWGLKKTLNKLRGVFTFSYFDPKVDKLFIVRDQMGSRPLYFFQYTKDSFFFSSEIKAFRFLNLKVDSEGIHEYLTFQNFLSSSTLFENVRTIPQGSWLEINVKNGENQIKSWFSLFEIEAIRNDFCEEELRDFVRQSISRNMESDFTIGSYLSSGIDSSLIVSTAHSLGFKIPTFSIGFEKSHETEIEDELYESHLLAQSLELDHYSKIINHTDMESIFDDLIWAIEEPRVGQSYPNYYAAQLASSVCKGVMSGVGGDELFGGYPWRYFDSNINGELRIKSLKEIARLWHRLLPENELIQFLGISKEHHRSLVSKVMNPYFHSDIESTNSLTISEILKFEFNTFLSGLLTIEDKISMHHNIETRVPFLDQDLIQFAFSLYPGKFFRNLSDNPEGLPLEGKVPLRNLFSRNNLNIGERKKRGFSGPDLDWFNNESREWIRDRLGDPSNMLWNYVSFDFYSKNYLNRKLESNPDRLMIWSLISLESSIRQFV